jgi:hypothetical protein
MGHGLTANETTLLAAGISAATSIVVTLLILRFGPNYKQQIKDVGATLAAILERQSSAAERLQQHVDASVQNAWQPSARVESTKDGTFLILKSDREFRIHEVTLRRPSGAVLHELPKSQDWEQVQSRGYRIPIPKEILTGAWNNSEGPRVGWTTAAFGYDVSSGSDRRPFTLPIMLKQEFHQEGTALIAWIRVTG